MTDSSTETSRIPGFYKLGVAERLRLLFERGLVSEHHYHMLCDGQQALSLGAADRMIENVVGTFSLPFGLGLNFVIDGRPVLIPLAVEEPSVVAALSAAAKTAGPSGGFKTWASEPLLVGQIQIVDVAHAAKSKRAILGHKDTILNLANSLHPNMVARGGGARDVEVVVHPGAARGRDMLVVHVVVDTRDAMGANLVNTICEGVAPLLERLSEGRVCLRILSNLCDRAMVGAKMTIPAAALAGKGYDGGEVRDGILLAYDFAAADPYRAATHNKGIMNGVDAIAIATGNDWRALEAAAHAYAARGVRYTSLSTWEKDLDGNLVGELQMPIKVGTVGGNLESNPPVQIAHAMLGAESATDLARIIGAVGLAQNFGALRALVTHGIQRGHMGLHARSVAMSAGAAPENFDTVVEKLVESGDVKVWKAKQILADMNARPEPDGIDDAEPQGEDATDDPNAQIEGCGAGFGKVILLGEHAVVYGSHALAAPVDLAIRAKVQPAQEPGVHVIIPRWGVELDIDPSAKGAGPGSLQTSLGNILDKLELRNQNMTVEVWPHVPRAMGLGGSAALAVGIVRALSERFGLALSDADVNGLAFEAEKVAHGNPSGIDNTLATYRKFMLFRKGTPPVMRQVVAPKPIPIVIGLSGTESLTAKMVARVHESWCNNKKLYERIFAEINTLTLQGVEAIEAYDLGQLGELMNVCQGLLNALGVSSWELEELIQIARNNGALGAKLTGGGGGGSIVAICPDRTEEVATAIRAAGYRAIITQIG